MNNSKGPWAPLDMPEPKNPQLTGNSGDTQPEDRDTEDSSSCDPPESGHPEGVRQQLSVARQALRHDELELSREERGFVYQLCIALSGGYLDLRNEGISLTDLREHFFASLAELERRMEVGANSPSSGPADNEGE